MSASPGGRHVGHHRVAWLRPLLVDLLGLAAIFFVLLDYLKPSLLLLPTVAAGGDTQCHFPTLAYFRDTLLPQLRFHGWYPGAYLGHPLLLYYFPLAFLVMSALAPLLGLGAAGALVFLFSEENPIWGGTIASTLTGEFSYTYGIGLALLFLGVTYRAYARGDGPWLPAAVLALTALAHGYAVLWGGLSAAYFLYASRRPVRTLGWLSAVAGLAFALSAFWLLPLLAAWGWTTPYDDPWITVSLHNLLPA